MSGPINRLFLLFALTVLVLAGSWGQMALAAPPMVKKIETQAEDGKFTLRVFLTAGIAPKIFPLTAKSKNPRVVVDFEKAAGLRSLPAKIETSSALVRAVRVGLHRGANPKVRLVLDLVPGYLYQVDQWFRRDINSYILVLTAQ